MQWFVGWPGPLVHEGLRNADLPAILDPRIDPLKRAAWP